MPPQPHKPPSTFTGPKPKEKISPERIFALLFIACGIGLILFMILTNKPEKQLVCDPNQPASLTGFGSCKEE